MKKLLLLLPIFSFICGNAQCELPDGVLVINSQAAVDAFSAEYGECSILDGSIYFYDSPESPITNLEAFSNVTEVTGLIAFNSCSFTSLEGFNNLETIGGQLEIAITQITDISALSSLTSVGGHILIMDNQIVSLAPLNGLEYVGGGFAIIDSMNALAEFDLILNMSSLPSDLTIHLGDNCTHIDGLSSVISVANTLGVSGAGLTNLNGLANLESVGDSFILGEVPLVTTLEPLAALTHVGGTLGILANGITTLHGLENVSGPTALELLCAQLTDLTALSELSTPTFLSLQVCAALTNLDGLENLTSLDVLVINYNTLLSDISALENITESPTTLTIFGNPSLAVCNYPLICGFVGQDSPNGGITGNAAGCATADEVEYTCNITNSNSLTGNVRFNYNNDDCAATEYTGAGVAITAVASTGEQYLTVTRADGTYRLFIPEGEFTLQVDTGIPAFSAPAQTVSFTGIGNNGTADFCISAQETVNDIRVTIYPQSEIRPGFNANYYVVVENIGSVVQDGNVTFTFDDEKLDLYFATEEPVTAEGQLTWSFEGLNPLQSFTFYAYFTILPPPVNENGQILSVTASADAEGVSTPENNTHNVAQELVGSYDPNDKAVAEGSEVLIEDAGDYLNYKIRFQNTGTASAIKIRLEDELDEKLDWSTFRPVMASHTYRVVVNEGFLQVFFDNINLPAQMQDDAGSNGFFMYKVKPKAGMEIGDIISNTADIYFDFNTPIVTNTVTTEFVTPAGIGENDQSKLAMYPNPARSVVHFRADSAIASVVLYNSLGQQVVALKSGEGISQMDVSHLASGLYMCHATAADGTTSVQKLVICK